MQQESGGNLNQTPRGVALGPGAAYLPPFGLGDFTVLTFAGPSLAESGSDVPCERVAVQSSWNVER
jgi:hypothetical protein